MNEFVLVSFDATAFVVRDAATFLVPSSTSRWVMAAAEIFGKAYD